MKKSSTLRTFKGLKKGTKIKVVNNSNSHNYEIDKIYSLCKNGTGNTMNDLEGDGRGNTLEARDCILCPMNLGDLKDEFKELELTFKKETKELKAKIKFCEDNHLEEYNEDYYKVFIAISELDSNSTIAQKASVITALLNG